MLRGPVQPGLYQPVGSGDGQGVGYAMNHFWGGYFVGVLASFCLAIAFPFGVAWGIFLGLTIPPVMACVFVVGMRDN